MPEQLLAQYAYYKDVFAFRIGAAEDILHVHAGLLIFFVAALFFRRRLRSYLPVAVVYSFAGANEVADFLSKGASTYRWEPMVDILNTVFWPTLIFLLARRSSHAENANRVARWF